MSLISKGELKLMRASIVKLVEHIRYLDEKYAPFTLLNVEKTNTQYELSDGCIVTLGGVVDRIDQKEGVVRVVDYKTSVFNPQIGRVASLFDSTKSLRNATALQALWYAWLYAQSHDQSSGISIQPRIVSTRNLFEAQQTTQLWMLDEAQKRKPIEDVRDYGSFFESELTTLLAELFDSATFFDQTTVLSRCMQCPYQVICQR